MDFLGFVVLLLTGFLLLLTGLILGFSGLGKNYDVEKYYGIKLSDYKRK